MVDECFRVVESGCKEGVLISMEIVQTMYLDSSKINKGALSCFWNSSSLRWEGYPC